MKRLSEEDIAILDRRFSEEDLQSAVRTVLDGVEIDAHLKLLQTPVPSEEDFWYVYEVGSSDILKTRIWLPSSEGGRHRKL